MSEITRLNRPNNGKAKAFLYYVWGEVMGAAKLALPVITVGSPLCRPWQVMNIQAKMQAQIQATDQKGAMLIGAAAPRVMVTQWEFMDEGFFDEVELLEFIRETGAAFVVTPQEIPNADEQRPAA